MTQADNTLIRYMWQVTNDMEGVTHNLPPFALFAEVGMDEEDIATILVHLENYYQRHINLPWLPECLMDICDIIQGRPRTLDKIRAEAAQRSKPYNYEPVRPPQQQGFWTKVFNFLGKTLRTARKTEQLRTQSKKQ